MDPDVIMSRLRKLDTLVGRLKKYQGISYEDYSSHEDIQAIVERLMQLSIQACIDIKLPKESCRSRRGPGPA